MNLSPPFFVVGEADTDVSGDVAVARAHFADVRALVCRGALTPDLVSRIDRICDRAQFRSDHVEQLGHRTVETPAIAGGAISLMLRRAPLFRWLEQVTGCRPISTIEGRVVETHPVAGDELVWHDDADDDRRILAITIALGSPLYEGGEFELRKIGQPGNLLTFRHDEPGTALVFHVSRRYEHRVRPLIAGGPRRVFTGWFLA